MQELRRTALLILVFCIPACREASRAVPDKISLAVPYEIETLDPHVKSKMSSFAVLSHFYEPLVVPAPDMKITPCLAESWENPDSLTWIFHLRPSVRFHNGKALDADDVVYSLKRVLQHPEFETAPYVSNVVEVSALNQRSVRIRTRHTTSILLNKLCFISIVPRDSRSENLHSSINGTGAYRLKLWEKDHRIVMIRNNDYRGSAPEISEAEFQLGLSDEQAWQKLLSGKCDFLQGISRKSEEAATKAGFKIVLKDSIYLKYIGFNLRPVPDSNCSRHPDAVQNRLVRKAIHTALDREKLVAGLNGQASPASQPVPPFTFGYDPGVSVPASNPVRARELLAEAGFPGGFETTMHVRKILDVTGPLVQLQLEQIGIKLQLKSLPDKEFFQDLRSGQFCMYVNRFGSPTGDASDALESALHTVDPGKHFGVLNYGRYSNPLLDAAIEESASIQNLDRRKKRLQEIMKMLVEDVVWVPLYVDQDIYIYDPKYIFQPRMDSLLKVSEISIKK